MHTATLKSGEGCASKAALESQAVSLAAAQTRPRRGGRGRAWAAGKTLGLKKTLPRQTQIQVHGRKKRKRESESLAFRASPPPDPPAQMWGHMWVPGCHMVPDFSAVIPAPPLGPRLFLGSQCQGCGLPAAFCQGWVGETLGTEGVFWFTPS